MERSLLHRPAFAAALATAVFAAWLVLGLGGETAVRWIDDLGTFLAALTAAVLCLRARSRHAGRMRLCWGLLAGACAAWTGGELIWGVYDLILGSEVPVPSLADASYLAATPLAAAALLLHPAAEVTTHAKARSALDGTVVATALLFLAWTLLLGPLSRAGDLSTLGGVVTLAYPFGDVVIIFLIVLVVRRMVSGDHVAIWCLLAGLLAITLSDSVYAYMTQVESYSTGSVIDAGWFAGYLAIGVGALSAGERPTAVRVEATAAPTPAAALVAFVPMLAALIVAGVQMQLGHRLDRVAWVAALVLVLLVLARQALLVVDLLRAGRASGAVEVRP